MTTENERPPSPSRSESLDARRLRAVDAFIDLVLEDEIPPTPDAVADRAGVSRATFFRYFSSLDVVRTDATVRVLERFPELFAIPAQGTGGLDDRIERFVDARVELYETLHALMLLLRASATRDAEASGFVDAARQVFADQVLQHFATDLRQLTPARRNDLVTAIAVLTSVESWQQFRQSHHRSPAQTRRAWRGALAGILAESRAR